ncbi:MAG TPA: hypothetical protein QGG70_04270 [Candidatus Pacearchaeota archaeon]|jgi:hypothetical protein|nr:hypothetical protein [Candidatus Pacearchaeota archaeon]|tara:strand:+ start:1296 stop:1490 length:195 start_codon:yes stop_codon:yes gene_type:complete
MIYENMNGMEVLWYLLTNWDEGKGLWFIIGFAVIAIIISVITDKYTDKDTPVVHIDYWGHGGGG